MITTMAVPQQRTSLPKHTPPLGPFPRYVWIHQRTPQDNLDKTCYEIWRRAQSLPEDMKPKKEKRKGTEAREWSVDGDTEKDEMEHLVEQEYINLIIEELNGLTLDQKSHLDTKTKLARVNDVHTPVEREFKAKMNTRDCTTGRKFKKAKDKLVKKEALQERNIAFSIAEFHNLKKFLLTKKYPNAKVTLDETRLTKSFKRNRAFSSIRSADKLPNLPEIKKEVLKQFPVLVKSCSKACSSEKNHISEKTSKDAEGLKALGTSGSDNRDVDPTQAENKDTMLVHEPLFKALEGNTEGKIKPPSEVRGTVTSKTTVPYTSQSVTPHPSSTPANPLNRPYQLNYLSSSGALLPHGAHYQTLFQHRPQIPFAPNQNSQLGYFSRQIPPFNPLQAAHPFFSPLYNPMMNYMHYPQSNYTCHPWNIPRITSTKGLGPMGGDAPQHLFPTMHRLDVTINRAMINNPYFSPGGNGTKPF